MSFKVKKKNNKIQVKQITKIIKYIFKLLETALRQKACCFAPLFAFNNATFVYF